MRTLLFISLFAAAAQAQMPPATQLPTGAPPLAVNATGTKFTFVVAGDNRPKKSADPLTKPFLDIVSRLAATPPAFVIWNGDTVFGKKDVGIAGQYAEFLAAMSKVPAPLFNAPGNHELAVATNMPCGQWTAEIPDWSGSMAAQYAASMGAPYGVFRYANAAFVLVNTDDVPDVAVPSACDYIGMVSQAQLTAMQATLAQLAADNTVQHIFFFMHRPIHDDNGSQIVAPAGTDYANRLTAFRNAIDTSTNSKVTFVFASHDHRLWIYPTPASLNGPFSRSVPSTTNPMFIVTGGAGAPLEGCPGTPAGAYYHYVSVNVDGSNVTVNIVPLYGTTPCATAANQTRPTNPEATATRRPASTAATSRESSASGRR